MLTFTYEDFIIFIMFLFYMNKHWSMGSIERTNGNKTKMSSYSSIKISWNMKMYYKQQKHWENSYSRTIYGSGNIVV